MRTAMTRAVALIYLGLFFAVAGMGQGPKKIPRGEVMSLVTSKASPEYPPVARQLKIEGVVEVEAVISESGHVETVTIVSGNPVLTKPAVEAVRKWKFAPQTQDGKPVRAIAPISLSFKL